MDRFHEQVIEDYMKFVSKWMLSHIEDGDKVMNKPVVFSEFGLSNINFTMSERKTMYKTVLDISYKSAKKNRSGGGCLVWQFLVGGMREFSDDFRIIPWEKTPIPSLFIEQSCRLAKMKELPHKFGSQDVWDIVEEEYNEPADDEHQTVNQVAALKKTRVKDRSALYFLYNAVDESGFEKIADAKSAKEAWEILKGDIQRRYPPLRREFKHMEMDENEGVSEFITQVHANQLGMNGEEVPPNRVAEKILRNLDDFESIVVTIEETKDLSTLTVEELAGKRKRGNPTIKHYRYGLTGINLELLRTEVRVEEGEEVEDEVDVVEVMIMKIKLVRRIGVTKDKDKAKETSQEWSVLSVASTATMQTSVGQQSATTVGSLVILQSTERPRQSATNMEKELKQKDEEIQWIGRLMNEANAIMNKQRVELEELKKVDVGPCLKSKTDEISTNSIWYLDIGGMEQFGIFNMGQIIQKVKKNRLYDLELKILERKCLKQGMTSKSLNNSNSNLIKRSKPDVG
ncbi:hypothetical protein V8G54_023364 [Vigna mungo]|uniref:Mannan endo-1,4-beta-mannosidase n=1 Tax=Vigna mungo TaxID=3915 RepID=A0AAQ3N3H2_VIGMU